MSQVSYSMALFRAMQCIILSRPYYMITTIALFIDSLRISQIYCSFCSFTGICRCGTLPMARHTEASTGANKVGSEVTYRCEEGYRPKHETAIQMTYTCVYSHMDKDSSWISDDIDLECESKLSGDYV